MDDNQIRREMDRMERQARAPAGSPDAPAGMDRATGVDDPTPRAEYRDDPPEDPPEPDLPDEITFTLPLEPDVGDPAEQDNRNGQDSKNPADVDGVSVDALFTALDHASAYHGHVEGNHYVDLYDLLQSRLYTQVREQL